MIHGIQGEQGSTKFDEGVGTCSGAHFGAILDVKFLSDLIEESVGKLFWVALVAQRQIAYIILQYIPSCFKG